MKKAPKIVILITAIALMLVMGVGAVSFASWDGSLSTEAEGETATISFLGAELDEGASLLVGEGGKLLPYSMPGAKVPDRNLIKLVFTNNADGGTIAGFEIKSVYASGRTAGDYVTLYYWNASSAPDKPIMTKYIWTEANAANGYWVPITSTAAAVKAGASLSTTDAASNTLYVAYDTTDVRDMNKLYQITLTAV